MSDLVPVRCSHCGVVLHVLQEQLGLVGRCPSCKGRFRIGGGALPKAEGEEATVAVPPQPEAAPPPVRPVTPPPPPTPPPVPPPVPQATSTPPAPKPAPKRAPKPPAPKPSPRPAPTPPPPQETFRAKPVEDDWYVLLEGKIRGPVTFKQLGKLVAKGRVARDTEVRFGLDGAWMLAEDARGPESRTRTYTKPASPLPGIPPDVLKLAVVGVVALIAVLLFVKAGGEDADQAEEAAATPQRIAARVLPAVAVVRGQRGSGSGFLAAPGLVVTNYHVIEHELLRQLTVEFPNAPGRVEAYEATLRLADPARDLAILAVEAKQAPLVIAKSHTFQPAQSVLIIGSPGLGDGIVLYNAVAQGLISTQTEIDGHRFYQLDAAVNPGNSGGPIFDDNGEVIGVVTARAKKAERLAFAVPHGDLVRALAETEAQRERDVPRVAARHRLDVAHKALLAGAEIYHLAMKLYVISLDPSRFAGDGDGRPAEGSLGDILQKIDRRLIAELRLEEDAIRNDAELTPMERERFGRLWALYAELKSAVDDPQGTLGEYFAQYEDFAERLGSLKRSIEADR